MKRVSLFASLLVLASIGCTGIGSRFIYRDETNSSWKQEKLRGVPVTVKVPTHVKISVVDRRYFYTSSPDNAPEEITNCSRGIDYEFILTSRLFTVDPKRPAAGTSNWEFDLEGQYPKTAKNEVNDLTIQQVSMAIETVARSGGIGKLFKAPKGKSASENADAVAQTADANEANKYSWFDSVVASRIFAIDDPMLEVHVEEFMNQHVNCRPEPAAALETMPMDAHPHIPSWQSSPHSGSH